jgi:hypothetical protein
MCADFESAASAWRWLADLRVDSGNAYVPDSEDDPNGPHSLDAVQLTIERFERKAQDYGILGTGEVLDESRGLLYRVAAED